MSDGRPDPLDLGSDPELAPFLDAMRRVGTGAVRSLVIPVDSNLIDSYGHRVALKLRLEMMSDGFPVDVRLHVNNGRPPTGKVTISQKK
jgi:hypothetical protein